MSLQVYMDQILEAVVKPWLLEKHMDHTPQPSIEDNEGSAIRKSISIEGTPREQSTASQGGDDNGIIISRGGRKGKPIGKHISKDDELQLFRICKKHETSHGHKGEKYGMTYFWNLVSRDFVEYRGFLPYSAESCRRRVTNKVRQRRADLEREETGREEWYTDWTMALDEWREVVDIYEAMEEGRKAESTKVQKEFAKANRMRDNLCKRRGNKRAIDSPAVTISSGDSDSDNDSDEVTELEARTDFRNPSPDFTEEPPASDIPHSLETLLQSDSLECMYSN